MSMNVQKHLKPIRFCRKLFLQHITYNFTLVGSILARIRVVISKEMPIHILTLQVASVVANYDTIGVDDGQDPYLMRLSKLVGQQTSRKQMVGEPMNDKTTVRFSRVLSTYNYDDGPFGRLVLIVVGYLDYGNVKTAYTCACGFKFNKVVN
jgi:hypothetical protein